MQVEYVDKYEERLKEAVIKANYIPSVEQYRIPSYEYLGIVEGKHEKRHYYYDKSEDKYYYESDFARQMRFVIRKNKFSNYTKK